MKHELPATADVVIIGGGAIGVSAAFHLAEAGAGRVLLLDQGSFGAGSTSKAAGGVRAMFGDPVNVELARRSLEAFADFPARPGQEIDLHRPGYLFLLDDPEHVAAMTAAVEMQNAHGVDSRMIDVDEAVALSPVIDPTGLLAAAFSPSAGYCSPESVVLGYASGARRHGATLIPHCAVQGIDAVDGAVRGVRTAAGDVATGTVVLAAGAWSQALAATAGLHLPVTPLRRQILVTETLTGRLAALPEQVPMTIDFSTSLYFHREGPGLLLGMSDPDEQPGFALDYSDAWLPRLTAAIEHRAPALADVGIRTGWAGLYEMTPDHNALVGAADDPRGLLYATGFSGHGFLMAPAMGETMRDLVLGRTPAVDVSSQSATRFADADVRPETVVV